MARIKNYVTDNNISEQDIVVGSDGDNSGVTKNFNVATLKQYITNGLVEEAPIDGITYARKDGDWVISSISSDEIVYVDTYADLPNPGSSSVLYITLDTGKMWLWNDVYSEVNQASISPFSTITEGVNVGIARTGRNPLYYGNIGANAIDMSSSTTLSSINGATGENSFASGKSNVASGNYSNAQNIYNKANGYASSASGMYSTASGQAETAIGMYGTEYVPTNTITDKVFNVGAGTSTLNKKDVFSLFRNLAAKFTPTALSSITNQVAGFFIFDSSDSNRPAIHNGTNWKKLAYQDDVPAISIDSTPTDGSTNAVSSNGVFDALANKVDKIADKGLSTNDYTTAEKNKLSGIEAGAEVNVNADWNATSGDAQILNKPSIPSVDSVPTNGSANAVSSDGVFDALSLKADLVSGKVPSNQLPSYVDDVIEGYYGGGVFYIDSGFVVPISGEVGKIYVDLLANKSYRWSGSVYIQISNAISSIDELTDVTVSSPLNGQLLQYNLTTNQWENQSITIGTGDMQKSTYDTDNDGIIDFAETVPVVVRNPSVSDILRKGTIVYLSGSTGYRPNAYKAQANSEATSSGTFGVVLSDIGTTSDGTVAMMGTVHTLDTRSAANGAPYPFTNDVLADGNALWLDPNNAGYVTNVKPQAPNHIVFIGVVARTHPSLGRIVYRITNGYELDELHNVFINGTLADKHTLYYDAATSLWKTNTITGTLGYTPENSANKSTSVVTDQASNTKYPTVKAVYDWAVGVFTTTSAVATQITTALSGYATQSWVTSQGYITNVISALGFTPVTNARTISTTSPLTGGGDLTANRTLSISQSNTTTDGYLSSIDWNTFNNKQSSLVSGTNIKTINGNSVLGSGNISITGGVVLTRQEFSYSGAQTFTLSATPSYIYAVFVNGQELNSSQYSFVTTTLTIADTLESGDKINIVYSETAGGVLDYYTKAQIDAFLTNANIESIIGQASASNSGYLASTDWTTFNNKQNAITLTTNNYSGVATFAGGTLNIPNYEGFIPKLKGHETFRGVNYSNNSTTEVTTGGITIATTGSTIARSVASTNYASKQVRKGFYGSVVSAGRYTGTRGSALLWYLGGGFKFICDVYISDTAYGSGCRQFYGMIGQTSDLTYSDSVLVDTMLNVIGVGSDALDTNLQVFHNDSSGVCTKVDLGVNFPANRTAGSALTTVYSIELYSETNASEVKYCVVNKETGATAMGIITTNLPLSTQGLNFTASRCMGVGITNTGQFDLLTLGVYSL